jgi:hypothetical protein
VNRGVVVLELGHTHPEPAGGSAFDVFPDTDAWYAFFFESGMRTRP